MKRWVFALLFVARSAYPGPTELSAAFQDAVKSPRGLDAFRRACAAPGGGLNFDGDDRPSKALLEAGTATAARAALYAESHCTDGASRLAVRGFLGNEFLLAHPAALAEAVAAEKPSAETLRLLVESEPTEFFAVDCKASHCEKERRAAFGKKRKALRGAKVSGAAKAARDRLLKALVSDR